MTNLYRKKAVFNWSGGKDSALALYKILQDKNYEIISLLTIVNKETQYSSMHRIPVSLLKAQAKSIGLPIYIVNLPPKGDINDYETNMAEAVLYFKSLGVNYFVFGDIFLEDVRAYREKQLKPFNIKVVEPLWGQSSQNIMKDFLSSGLKTIIITTDAEKLGEEYIGQEINMDLLNSFPKDIDICGEKGEYHTFCYDGKIFKSPIKFSLDRAKIQNYKIKDENGIEKEFRYWYGSIVP